MLTGVLAAFSLLAVTTSFIGSVVGLTAFASEQLSLIPTSADRSFSETSHQPVQPIPVPTVDRHLSNSSPTPLWGEEGNGGDAGVEKGAGGGGGGRKKAVSYLLVLLPPLACAVSSPDAFYWATEVAVSFPTDHGCLWLHQMPRNLEIESKFNAF